MIFFGVIFCCMHIAREWKEYELIDAGDGEKVERWGPYVLRRPDPQALWPKGNCDAWNTADAHYCRNREGGGYWNYTHTLPKRWTVSYKNLKFFVEPMSFKHTGIFPEQAVNWDWMIEKIRSVSGPVRILNLFAYTGAASVAMASAMASVCHVDSSKGMIERAKENLTLNGIEKAPVRFIVDDVLKFVEREGRRGNVYDAIIMDPPSFGRGPKGELWKIECSLFPLLERCAHILSDRAIFFLINSYTTEFSPTVFQNMLELSIGKNRGGKCSSFEIGLQTRRKEIVLPCGSSARWE